LHDLQAAFARAVLDDEPSPELAECIAGNGLPADRRLRVYRNNTLANLGQALEAAYPVVSRLVGEEFFEYLARQYLRAHPSRRGDLETFGDALPGFLETFEPASGLPYLADVARLEWHWHSAYHAADHPAFEPARLADVPAEQQGELRARLHPAARLLASPWPVLRIVQVNQPGRAGEETVDLDEGGVQVLVRRNGHAVEARALAPAEFALLTALYEGASLEEATGAALCLDPDFELAPVLARHVSEGTVVDIFPGYPDPREQRPRPGQDQPAGETP